MKSVAQRAFSAGEVSPSLFARVDLARYHIGLKTCRNFIVQQDGGVVNDPGTMFIAEVKDSSKAARLIKFVNDNVTYVIELGDAYARFYRNQARIATGAPAAWVNGTVYAIGDLVSQGGVNYYATAAHTAATATNKPGSGSAWATVWYAETGTIYEIPTPYTTSDLSSIRIVQLGDTIRMVCAGIAPRELTRYADNRWTLMPVAFSPRTASPTNIAAAGGLTGPTTYWAVTAVMDKTFEESLPGFYSAGNKVPSVGTPTTLSWNPVSGAISYNIYRSTDGATYGYVASAGGSVSTSSDTSWTDSTETASSSVAGVYAAAAGQCSNPLAAISATVRAGDGKYTVKYTTTLASGAATVGLTRGRVGLYYKRSTDAVKVLYGYVYVDPVGGANQTSGPISQTSVIEVPDDGYTTLEINLVPEVNPGAGGSACTMNADTSVGPDNEVSWTQNAAGYSDIALAANNSVAPPSKIETFDSVARYPRTTSQFQQRAVYANSATEPRKIWASKTGSSKNFAYSTPIQADDPVVFEIDSAQANPIIHLLDLGRLIVFTSVSEHVIEGDQSGILKPDAINPRAHSRNGASTLQPIVLNNRALYVQARGSSVRSIRHDDVEGSINTNLSIFASHLFRGKTIVDWDLSLIPNSVLWAIRSDGVLLGLTYIPELDVWGWHRHDTDGNYENVCTVPETTIGNPEDVAYFVVKRTINGATKRYVEYMPSRYYSTLGDTPFVHCGIKVAGPVQVVTGLDYLEGKSVSVQSDGGVVRASPNNSGYTVLTVAAGQIDLGAARSNIVIGLPYISDVETLDIDTPDANTGSIKHGRIRVSKLVLLLDNTAQLWVGMLKNITTPLNKMQPLKKVVPAEDTALATGAREVIPVTDFGTSGRMLVRQVDPAPATILMISPALGDME